MISIKRESYQEFCNKEKIPIFLQPFWLDSVCEEGMRWEVLLYKKGGQTWAVFPYFIKNSQIIMPKLTQTIGVYIKYPPKQKYYKKLSWENEIMSYFINNLPKFDYFNVNFHYSIVNWLPFYWKGFQQTTRYTYTIDKNINFEELYNNFETDIRRRIKKANYIGIEVFESNDIEMFYKVNKMTFDRQNMQIPYSLEFIKNLYFSCKKNNACKMYFAKYADEVIAVNFLVFDASTVYYLMGGINPSKKDLGAMDCILYESIKFSLNSKRNFDFEGSMIRSIEKYFRGFGAIQHQYFQISKINSKKMRFIFALKDMVKAILK